MYEKTWGRGERKLGLQVFLRESANVQEEEEVVVVVVVVVVVIISRRGSTLADECTIQLNVKGAELEPLTPYS